MSDGRVLPEPLGLAVQLGLPIITGCMAVGIAVGPHGLVLSPPIGAFLVGGRMLRPAWYTA